jgi:hypothetical protein
VFISQGDLKIIRDSIHAIEKIINTEKFQQIIFQRNPLHLPPKSNLNGVFMGYDFHQTPFGPKLIEINTNAGGGILNFELLKSQINCCGDSKYGMENSANRAITIDDFIQMFLNEWKLSRGDTPLKSIAIVDDEPTKQYLYPEFKLIKSMFESHGIKAFIVDPQELCLDGNILCFKGTPIDFVYNRLTDFHLDDPTHSIIRRAWEKDSIVLSPNPFHHFIYANKLNLTILSDTEMLSAISIPGEMKKQLESIIPKTVAVNHENADHLWSGRKSLFFKPSSGYGSKATYRGDKLTHKVWEEILQSNYVAQTTVPPGTRKIKLSDNTFATLKYDLRAYTYDGKIQLMAARLYSGQTTNFRTQGGGFAPVFVTSIA